MFSNRIRDRCFVKVKLNHVAFMPVPCLTDVWIFVNDLIKFVGISFQLNHIAKHKSKAAEYLPSYPKHHIFLSERHIFRGIWF